MVLMGMLLEACPSTLKPTDCHPCWLLAANSNNIRSILLVEIEHPGNQWSSGPTERSHVRYVPRDCVKTIYSLMLKGI